MFEYLIVGGILLAAVFFVLRRFTRGSGCGCGTGGCGGKSCACSGAGSSTIQTKPSGCGGGK